MKEFNENKKIEDAEGFNEYASDLFERFLKSFEGDEKLLRPVTENDDHVSDESIEFIYTRKGMNLAERMLKRLYAVGFAHYNSDDGIEIETTYFREA